MEAETSALEDEIISAVNDEQVSQAYFNALLHQWVKQSNPVLSGVKLQRGYAPPYNTTFLSGQYTPSLADISGHRIEEYGFSGVGLIVQPFTADYLRSDTLQHFDGIAIDNGMFTEAGQRNFTWDKYEKMVKMALAQEKREILRKFHFFTVPDQPFDWAKTMQKFQASRPYVERLRKYGAPVAICVQNGATDRSVPWDDVDVIFIGGDDKWKTGAEAQAIVQEAQKRRKTVHMGRVNNLKRMNVASGWGVETADGTYIMHELAKSLHDIERKNPMRRGESPQDYTQRLKRILHGQHQPNDLDSKEHHHTEPEIVGNFVNYVLDNQQRSNLERRYNSIATLIKQMGGRPLHKRALWEYDRFMPQVPGVEHDEDVVEFDPEGYVRIDGAGRPVRNAELFRALMMRVPYRAMPEGIPVDAKNYRVYTNYINRYIARMRDLGVMPK